MTDEENVAIIFNKCNNFVTIFVKEEGRNMMNKGKKLGALVIIMGLMLEITAGAETVAVEEQVEGASVLLEQYCNNMAKGTLQPEKETAPAAGAEAAPTAASQPEQEADAHVQLNLNYDRLGIANKVDTYLNVRKKPSESGKIVGKMTKNAGCHIYSIKKGWAKIVSGKVKGYVKASYMTTDAKAEALAQKVGRECVEIQTDSLRVRALPSTTAPI